MKDFRKLDVWQKAHRLALNVYAHAAILSRARQFYLADQIRRASLSVPGNIAEGCGRTGDREFRRFLRIALGSASELEYYLLLARDLGFLPDPAYEQPASDVVEIKRMLTGLIRSLKADSESSKAES